MCFFERSNENLKDFFLLSKNWHFPKATGWLKIMKTFRIFQILRIFFESLASENSSSRIFMADGLKQRNRPLKIRKNALETQKIAFFIDISNFKSGSYLDSHKSNCYEGTTASQSMESKKYLRSIKM